MMGHYTYEGLSCPRAEEALKRWGLKIMSYIQVNTTDEVIVLILATDSVQSTLSMLLLGGLGHAPPGNF